MEKKGENIIYVKVNGPVKVCCALIVPRLDKITKEDAISYLISIKDEDKKLDELKMTLRKIEPPIPPAEFHQFLLTCGFTKMGYMYGLFQHFFYHDATPELTFQEFWAIMQPFYQELCCDQQLARIKPVATWAEFWKIVDKKIGKYSFCQTLIELAVKIVQEAPTGEMVLEMTQMTESDVDKLHVIEQTVKQDVTN